MRSGRHCEGVKKDGIFVHSLTLTDIHDAWTEYTALAVRQQSLVVEGIKAVARRLPFALCGLDTDNDSVFMNKKRLLRYRANPKLRHKLMDYPVA